MDILRKMSAPWKPEKKDDPVGQGYWIQAEFGSGKSHLLCLLAALALGSPKAWDIVSEKEKKSGRGKRETLYRFWEDGLKDKSGKGSKGIFVIVKTLVGVGDGTVGVSSKGRRLAEYIIDAAKEQIEIELGKNLSLYPSELLADRFINDDLDRYKTDLKKFLNDPKYFDEDQFEDINDFIRDIQQDKSPEYKRSCGNKLWRFYTEYLKVQPQVEAETEDILKHLVKTILDEGYSGVLLVLDELSLFMKNRDDSQRVDDEKTLVVLSNRLAKIENLPIWTVCAAQQAIESKMGVKNIIADDRLKLVKLLGEDKDYYDIVLARVREIKDESAVGNYFLHYKKGFTWPASVGEKEFAEFFPFHKPALEVLRAITYELTTARSAIHFMHQTLKNQIKNKGNELIRLWELFDEAVKYEEDPSGVHAGLTAIKTKKETEYKAYEACKRQIDGLTKGYLKVNRDKVVKTIQTMFLYHIAKTRQQGLTPEEISNSVLIEREPDSTPEENIQHYETMADSLKKELRQIVQTFDEDKRSRYRFDPVFTGVDPRDEFKKARDEAESNQQMQREAWDHLLALDEWPVKTRQITMDLSGGVKSIFRDVSSFVAPWEDPASSVSGDQVLEINWLGRQTLGLVGMRDLLRINAENTPLPAVESDQNDQDYAVFIGASEVKKEVIDRILARRKDPRVILWTPGNLTSDEKDRLFDFAAYRKLIFEWQGKDTEDAMAVISWVADTLKTDLGKIAKIIDNSYARGRMDAIDNSEMSFSIAGELANILTPIVDRVLNSVYESREIKFDQFYFRREEGVKLINGIVRSGNIPKGAKPNQNISAAQNFGFGMQIMKKKAEKQLDTSDNQFVKDIENFIDEKLTDAGQTMKIDAIYKNFMGIGGPKDYGLMRRMIQIFMLCLVREGKIKIGINAKSGLQSSAIDYSNIEEIDFSVKILDSFTELQKMAKPENWEILRPYAEKLLGQLIPPTADDAKINECRSRLNELFKGEKDNSKRLLDKTKVLFDVLEVANPYSADLDKVAGLFSESIEGADDINMILFALKKAMGYEAFDKNVPAQNEVDDLANRLKSYGDLKVFMNYESDVRTAHSYCRLELPDNVAELKDTKKIQGKLKSKLANIQPFIDSEVKLKTEFIGNVGIGAGDKGTLAALIEEYTSVYINMHDNVHGEEGKAVIVIDDIIGGDELKALRIIEGINALKPAVSDDVKKKLEDLKDEIPQCSTPSRESIEKSLKLRPYHEECKLTFINAASNIKKTRDAGSFSTDYFDSAINGKIEILLNEQIRKRLEQGAADKRIKELLNCKNVQDARALLVKECLADESLVDVINKYLKKIEVKKIRISDFKPSASTIEKEKIPALVQEFQKYVEEQFESMGGDDDTLPMLQLE